MNSILIQMNSYLIKKSHIIKINSNLIQLNYVSGISKLILCHSNLIKMNCNCIYNILNIFKINS